MMIHYGRSIQGRVVRPGEPISYQADSYSLPLMAPENRRPCIIEPLGDLVAGEQLRMVRSGAWAGNPRPDLTYQWRRDALDIVGETGGIYTLDVLDEGTTITCLETATNSQGAVSQASNGIFIPVPPP